jgi:hypothetical protein
MNALRKNSSTQSPPKTQGRADKIENGKVKIEEGRPTTQNLGLNTEY